jgi:flagellar biosynthesis anti-sigma factor FlgM
MKVSKPEVAGPAKVGSDGPVRNVAKAQPVERISTVKSAELNHTIDSVRAQLPAERAAKVAQIAHAVKKGQYTPNAQAIADRILDEAQLDAKLRAMLPP